jgi:ABC-type transporter Mla subunit MlaD
MGAVAPVSQTGARLFTDMATTFEAISRDPNALESTIAQSPSTLNVATNSLQTQQPLLSDLATLGRALTPASASLGTALPQIDPALEVGTSTLRRAPVLNANLQGVMRALKSLAQAPGTNIAINALSATAPVNGGGVDSPLGGNEFLHNQVYGAAVDNRSNADCENGQRGYPSKLNPFDPQGRKFVIDQHSPGDQGATFHGLARVPAGETFSRNPQTGPQTPFNRANP